LIQQKFNYLQNIETETKSTGRTYFTPAGNFPSITTILGKTANNIWLQRWIDKVGVEEAARISKIATDRGSLVHSYAERFFNNEDISLDLSKENYDVNIMSKGIIKEVRSGLTELWGQEAPLWSTELKFAGRADMIGTWKQIPSIIDFKTSKKKKSGTEIKDYFLQTAGYAFAHNELFNTRIYNLVIIIAIENGDVQIFEKPTTPFIPDLRNRISQYYKNENL